MKKSIIKKNGFTLVEIIVVLVILGILAAIIVPSYIRYIDKARTASDLVALRTLNTASIIYGVEKRNGKDDIFDGFDTDLKRMQELVGQDCLDEVLEPEREGAEFNWSVSDQIWLYNINGDGQSLLKRYVFADMKKDDFKFYTSSANKGKSWSINDEGLYGNGDNYDSIFFENDKREYTLTTNFRLNHITRNNGGLGVFFETQ